MHLQESDMFMDALITSTKAKEPRKRKRKTSTSKESSSGSRSKESLADDVTPPGSPSSPKKDAEEKTIKPNFKFYQDTLETEEEKSSGKETDGERENSKSETTEDEAEGSRSEFDDFFFF